MRNLSIVMLAAIATCAPFMAQASTRLACDWGGVVASDPQSRQIYLENGSETTQISFDMTVTRSVKTRNTRSDSSCDVHGDGVTKVALTNVFFDRKKGDPVAIRYFYMDDSGMTGHTQLLLIDCSIDRSAAC